MKVKAIGIILFMGILMMSCGVQSGVDTGDNKQIKKQKINYAGKDTSGSQWEEVGIGENNFCIAVGDDGQFYYAEILMEEQLVYLFDSTAKQIGRVRLKKGYDGESIKIKNGRILIFTENVEKGKALLYSYTIADKTVNIHKIPYTSEYILYKNCIYFSMEEDGEIIKTNLKGEIKKRIQIPEKEFRLNLIYRDRIFIQEYVYLNSYNYFAHLYSVDLEGNNKQVFDFGKDFENKFGIRFDASDGYVYMLVTNDDYEKVKMYRFIFDSNHLEYISTNKEVGMGAYVIGEENIFYVPENSSEIYAVNKRTQKEKLYLSDGYTIGSEQFMIASKDSLIMQSYGVSDGRIMVVPQEYEKGLERWIYLKHG